MEFPKQKKLHRCFALVVLLQSFSNVRNMRKGREYNEDTAIFQDGLLSYVKS